MTPSEPVEPTSLMVKAVHLDLLLVVGTSLLMALVVGPHLPARFSVDAAVIADRFGTGGPFRPLGSSFTNTAVAYGLFGIGAGTPLLVVSVFNLAWAWLVTAVAVRHVRSKLRPVRSAAALAMGVPLGVYLFPLTKEFTSLVLALALLVAWQRLRPVQAVVASTLAMTVYAGFIRDYWILVAFVTLASMFCLRSRLKAGALTIFVVPVAVALYSLAIFLMGRPFAAVRAGLNAVGDRATTTDSLIVNVIDSANPLLDLLNTGIVWLATLVPVPMLLSFDATQTGFALFQILLTIVLVGVARTAWRTRRWRTPRARELHFLFCTVVAYTIVQALFEPDYGSIVRHRAFLFLVILRLWLLRDTLVTWMRSNDGRPVPYPEQGHR